MKPLYNYNKLKGRIKEYCGTLEDFAKDINTSYQSLNKKLKCETYFTQIEIDKAIKVLNISADEIFSIFFNQEVEKN